MTVSPTNRAFVLVVTLVLFAIACSVSTAGVAVERTVPSGSTTPDDPAEAAITGPPDNDPTPSPAVTPSTVGGSGTTSATAPPRDLPRDLTVEDIGCALPVPGDNNGLSPAGEAMFQRHVASGAPIPTYALVVDVDPVSGTVAGAMRATIPAQDRTINFRVFAGMEAFDSRLRIDHVTQNGQPVEATLNRALLSLPASPFDEPTTTVELDFSYTISQLAANENLFGALSGDTLQPDQVGLLGRTQTGMQLGHWFPIWLPDGTRSEPDPSGFGDIGAFPAANICATITVPPRYEVVTGGVRVAVTDTSVVEAGLGLRDFSILISDDLSLTTGVVDNVEIRVWGPAEGTDALLTVLDHAVRSQRALVDAFGPYPWVEIDLVSAPLGGGVGGMEWPGMIWIEQSMFAGGLPGLGEFGDLFGTDDLESLLGSIGGDALATSLEWTVAHELGHEWWHATIGNDSIESPAVDEPLAQFSACIAMQQIHPDNWRDICEAQTTDQYAQARSLGVADATAEQPSDAFDSSLQYGAIIYGKAPGFYLAAADLVGWDNLIGSLRSFVAANSFALVRTDALRSHLITGAGDDGQAIADLWDRWFRETAGDEDIEASEALSGIDIGTIIGLEGFEGLDNIDLEELNLDELLGDIDLEALFGEDTAVLEDLLNDLLNPAGED